MNYNILVSQSDLVVVMSVWRGGQGSAGGPDLETTILINSKLSVSLILP